LTAEEVAQMEARQGGGDAVPEQGEDGIAVNGNGSAKRKAGDALKSDTPTKKAKGDSEDDQDDDT